MSSLENSVKHLTERGLVVTVLSPDRLHVRREGDRTIELASAAGGYRISSWDCVPGPGKDDFLLTVPTVDALLLIAWCYYFAKSIEIDGWELPLHRRPYWNLSKLHYVVATT
jgi:hypothetical protein